MYDEYESQGLTILGVTGEGKEQTEPWIEKHGAQYPYAYLDKEGLESWMKSLGMGGYPSAALVDTKGRVAWVGHPAGLTGGQIADLLAGANKTPVEISAVTKNWPADAKSVAALFAKGQLGKATEAATKLGNQQVIDDLARVVARRIRKLEDKRTAGDFLGYLEAAEDVVKTVTGLPEAATLADGIKAVKADKDAQRIVRAQKQLQKIASQIREGLKNRDREPTIKKLRAIQEEERDNFAGATAKKLRDRIVDDPGH